MLIYTHIIYIEYYCIDLKVIIILLYLFKVVHHLIFHCAMECLLVCQSCNARCICKFYIIL